MINDNERKYVYAAITVIVTILIIVLIYIWSPMFKDKSLKKEIGKLSDLTDDDYSETVSKQYLNDAKKFIDASNVESTIDCIDESYLAKNNLDRNNVGQYLIDNKILGYATSSTNLYLYKIQKSDGKYIYTYRYNFGAGEKQIHFIEDYYKNYTISFEQDSFPTVVSNFIYEDTDNSISYDVSVLGAYENSILFQIKIKNNSSDIYKVTINSINDASATINGGAEYKLSSVVVGSNSSEVISNPNSTVTLNLSLDVPLENQSGIKNIALTNVLKNNFEASSLNIVF